MNILFLHRWTGVRGGGTETHIKGIIKNLQNKHNIILLTRDGLKISELKKLFNNITIHTVSRNIFEDDNSYKILVLLYFHTFVYMTKIFMFLLYLMLIKKQKIDVISVHFATEAVIANIIKKLFKIPYIFVLEGYTDWEAYEAKKADGVISISKYISKKCKIKYGYYPPVLKIGEDKFPYIKNDLLTKKSKAKIKNVLTLCRLEPRKNLLAFVETVNIICKKYNRADIKFIFGGIGIDKEIILKKIKDYKLNKCIKYFGYVKEKDIIKTYQNSHIYFLPTFEEGFGIVYLEAMKSGCPIVSTKSSAIGEVVKQNGILISNPYNYEKYAKAIIKLVDNNNLLLKKAKYGISEAKKYNWEKIILQYEKIYKSVIKN